MTKDDKNNNNDDTSKSYHNITFQPQYLVEVLSPMNICSYRDHTGKRYIYQKKASKNFLMYIN